MSAQRLAIVTTHPIQYHAPWFRALAATEGLEPEVIYCHQATENQQAAAGFGVQFAWDIPLLEGYRYRFLHNSAAQPAVTTFAGVNTPEIATIIAQEKFAAVLVNGWHYRSAWQAIRACWRTRTPVLVRSDSHLHTPRHPLKKVAKWPFYRWFVRKFDACLAAGTWAREYFLHYGASPAKIFTSPHTIDVARFARAAESLRVQRAALRQEWGLAADAVVFLFVAKFVDKKRPADFIAALAQAAARNPRICGLMVGDGPLRALCEAQAKTQGAPIAFAGFLNQSQITKAYAAADMLIMPSDGGETWGLVVNEALACGVPCLVSDAVGCGPDLIRRQETGEVFPLGAVTTLAERVAYYAHQPDLLHQMSLAAHRQAQTFTPEGGVFGVQQALAALTRK